MDQLEGIFKRICAAIISVAVTYGSYRTGEPSAWLNKIPSNVPSHMILLYSITALYSCRDSKKLEYSDYVDPFIGTANSETISSDLSKEFTSAHVYPGAVVPWGMVAISPRNTIEKAELGFGKDPSGYFWGEQHSYGFGQIHLSGVGCPDWGNILVMPTLGRISLNPDETKSNYSDESANPGYYKVHLDDYEITAEVSATTRTSITKYTFHKGSTEANILFDLYHNLTPSKDGLIRIVSDNEAEGWNENGGFCDTQNSQRVFFTAKFSKSANASGTLNNEDIFVDVREQSGAQIGGYFQFNMDKDEELYLKIGISFVSMENARLNLETEQPDWDFGGVRKNARASWEEQLSKIRVEGGTEAQRKLFYTALYRTLIHPST